MTNTENAGEDIVLDQKEEVLNLRQEEDNSEENNEKPKTKDASSKGENQAEENEEEVEEEEEEKDQNIVQEIREVNLQEQQDEKDDNEEKEKKDDNEEKEEKDDQNQDKSEENENEDNNQKPQEEVNLRIVRDNDDDDVKKSDLYLNLQPNLKVKVEWFKKDDDMNIEFSTASKSKVLLHWGVFKNNNTSQWCQPNNQFYPRLTSEPDAFSLNTEFSCLQDDDSEQKIFIRLPTDSFDEFNFVFYNQDEDIWHNNFGQDYHIKNE